MNTEDKSSTSLLDEMRTARVSSNVAFINFIDNHNKFNSHVFCFYEGEDGKYYNQRIKSIIGDNIIPIKTGNKRETIKIWRKIKSEPIYNNAKKMFFIDKDMDDIPEDKDEDLYITPCYSIENFYVNSQTFGSILESEFSLSRLDNDYAKCLNTFEKLYEQFNNEMIEFNALILLRKQKEPGNGKVNLKNIKTRQMISVKLDRVKKGSKYNEFINQLKTKLSVNDEELADAIDTIKTLGDYPNLFRGKNQLDFMVILLNILKQLNAEGKFFDKKQTSVTINLTGNRLSELSQYAAFPSCLKEFIQNHKIA
ncbi:MAG: DUF4435 domain-containing protein [Candidatus Ornithomonoglobus sp.]